jgi:hypothetical protein
MIMMRMVNPTFILKIPCTLLILVLSAASPRPAEAIAYCSLRDPISAIQNFFPNMTDYRSFLGAVDLNVRDHLQAELGYDMHFNEFGKHTLYLVYADETPVGLVQARTEKGDWGLDEIAWALDFDFRVRDFRYQRSRSRWRHEVETQAFKNELIGKNFEELKSMLSNDGMLLTSRPEFLAPEAEQLATTVIRSALKTIAVTQVVWRETLESQLALTLE